MGGVEVMVALPKTLSHSCRPPGNFSRSTLCRATGSTSGNDDAMRVSVPTTKKKGGRAGRQGWEDKKGGREGWAGRVVEEGRQGSD